MNFDKANWHRQITIISLVIAVVALPYSVLLCHTGIIILTFNWIIQGQWKTKWSAIQFTPAIWPLGFYFLLSIIGSFYSNNFSNGIFNIEKKLAFIILPVVLATTEIDNKGFKIILKSFVFTCFIAVAICFVAAAYRTTLPAGSHPLNFDFFTLANFRNANPDASTLWSHFSYIELSSGIHLHPTYLGIYLLFSIVILVWLYSEGQIKTRTQKIITTFLITAFSIFIFLLSARIVIISYFLVFLFITGWLFMKTRRQVFIVISFIVIITGIAFVFINPISRYRATQEISYAKLNIVRDTEYAQSLDIRYSLWWLGIQSIKNNNWIIGSGTGDVNEVMKKTASTINISNTLNTYDPHNQFMYTTIATGALGLITLLMCFISPLLNEYTRYSFLYPAFILIIAITCLTESILEFQKGIAFFVLFHSLIVLSLRPQEVLNLKPSHA